MNEFLLDETTAETMMGLGLVVPADVELAGLAAVPGKRLVRPAQIARSAGGAAAAANRLKDIIHHTIWSKKTLGTGTNTRYQFFSGTPSQISDGNVTDGVLPAPQSMEVFEVSVYTSGIAGAILATADVVRLGDAVFQLYVANKLQLEVPLWKIGVQVSGITQGTTPATAFSGRTSNVPAYVCRVPVLIPMQQKFEAYLTTSEDALSGAVEATIALSGKLTRSV